MRVLVTGGTGRLGRLVVAALRAGGHDVEVMSSRPVDATVPGDLATGAGLVAALAGAEGVVHAASSPSDPWQVDVVGTRRLVQAADRNALRHLVFVSIVGVDRNPYGYYRAKLAAEQVLLASGLPVTVLRATQFHTFVDMVLAQARQGPVLPVPRGWPLQPVATEEVADHVAGLVDGPPAGDVRELAGPEPLGSTVLARLWAGAQPRPPRVLPLPVPGTISAAFRAGSAVPVGGSRGRVGYAEHLRRPLA